MKPLKSFEKELNKCSNCGLCTSVCPIFKITKNDCTVSKGKFQMLYGVTKGDLELSKNIDKYIDMCLKCSKCNDFCPSSIDVCQILNTAKYEYTKQTFKYYFIRAAFDLFEKFIGLFGKLRKKESKNSKIAYFKGCVNNIFPNTDKYLGKILKNTDFDYDEPEFSCCGLPFLSEGDLERFELDVKKNTEILKKYKYVVTDCASCEYTLKQYSKYTDDFPNLKFKNWGEIIAKEKIKFKFEKPVKVTFHKPCHLENDKFFEKIIKNCENVEYVKMNDYDECCGFAGSFALKNKKISEQIMKQKGQNIINSDVEYVITTCPSCVLGLKKALKLNKSKKIKVLSLLEFLSLAENR